MMEFICAFLTFYSIYLILSISLNIEYGYTGIPNFGKVMFFGAGAFTVGALTSRLLAPLVGIDLSNTNFKIENIKIAESISKTYLMQRPIESLAVFLGMLALGAIIGGIIGWLASYPAIRLREDYLGMTLVVAGELIRLIAYNYDPLICGTFGVHVPNVFGFIKSPEWTFDVVGLGTVKNPLVVLGDTVSDIIKAEVMFTIALSVWFLAQRLMNSPFGRLLRAVRDNEVAAEALGKDVAKTRMIALVIGSAMAGLAGSMYAFYTLTVHATDFTPIRTFVVWVMVVLGGAGNNVGAVVGTLIYLVVERGIAMVKQYFPMLPFDINYLSYIIMGALLVLILMYKSEGLIPEKPPKYTEE